MRAWIGYSDFAGSHLERRRRFEHHFNAINITYEFLKGNCPDAIYPSGQRAWEAVRTACVSALAPAAGV